MMTRGEISVMRSTRTKSKVPFTILIVEDNATDVELMLHALEAANLKSIGGDIDMEVRATAEGALRLLGERAVDLVLTDMVLPGMDGLDLVSRIQRMDPNLPVLVVTRMNAVPLAVDAMRRGAFDYVLKPVNAVDLGMRLHRAIRISEILRRHAIYEQQDRQEFEANSFVGSG
ncbi:MAG: response regulator, partial [Nitrospirae bacterium]|nr:response regulator [Nitrospirota bacterium]